MPFKTPHPVFQTTDTFQQLVDDLNTQGSVVDSNFHYVDSAIGPDAGSGFTLAGLLTTSGNLVDAINELDSDLFGAGGGAFKSETSTTAKTVVGAIVELDSDLFGAGGGTFKTEVTTTAKTVIGSVNELDAQIDVVDARIPNVYNRSGTHLNP